MASATSASAPTCLTSKNSVFFIALTSERVSLPPLSAITTAEGRWRGLLFIAEVLTDNILTTHGRSIRPKSLGQKAYTDAIEASTITFGIGPAGTGKTYLAMAKTLRDRKSVV